MGVFSAHNRYREAGEQANVNNVARFGEPYRSLFTSTKLITLHHHIDITDENNQLVYQARSKAISLHNKTDITDAAGNEVAHIETKLISIHERHFITMADGTTFQLSTELLHLVKEVLNIEEFGWQLRGNIFQLNFVIYDQDESVIAVIGQKMISMHDKYCVDIYKPEYEQKVVALLVTLQHIIYRRQVAASSSASH